MIAKDLHPLIKINLVLLLFFLVFGGLYLASSFLIPLVFAGVLAMLMTPLCVKLEARGIPKALSSFFCILLLLFFFAGIGFVLSTQIAGFAEDLPRIEREIDEQLYYLQEYVQQTFGITHEQQKEAVQDSSPGGMSSMVAGFLNSFTGIMTNAILVLVYMFLLLYYRSRFPKFIMKVVSDDQKKQAHHIINESSKVAQRYLIGRGILIFILAVLYSVGMAIIGLDNAIFLSLIAALLSIIPYVGNIIGLGLLMLMALAQGGTSSMYISIIAVFSVTQFIESYLLEPFIVGAEVDIHPFFTVVIIIIGELIWGVPGMILAIPMLGIVKIIFSHIDSLEPYAYLIGDTRNSKNKASGFIKRWFNGNK